MSGDSSISYLIFFKPQSTIETNLAQNAKFMVVLVFIVLILLLSIIILLCAIFVKRARE